ncbi:MAG TPA: helix-turn-helix domain-containing protein [Ktedonobacteraceae bacterium]|nr:helix-turn-helix domain-containing protein [Ktedonobacteraceae bacterium]
MAQEPQYYTVREVARILGVDEETVRRWCRLGKITGVKRFGREYRIPRISIDSKNPPQEEKKK